ncbi:MAG TPA: hypothetical protein VN783_09675 [Thermoanaerobaculia bacterium]|nr:hypothetical protein [Thermoanaerobaculia bacterium]
MTICRRFAASLLLAVLPLALAAQQQERLSLLGFTFRHQPSGEALALVQPMLSSRGTVELQAGNKMVVHDARVILARILPMLREFDHPVRALDLEVMVVKASRAVMSPPVSHSDLPPDLTRRLRSLLPYDIYELSAQAQLATYEGQEVAYEIGPDYQVSFRVGTVLADRRVRLAGFQMRRSPKGSSVVRPKPLLFTNLNLALDQTMSLGLAKSEESREALMIVLTLRGAERRSPDREP